MCTAYNVLPAAGGLFDQDPYVIYGLTSVLMAIDQKEQLEADKQKAQAERAKKRGR